jgi:ubiquinone/menaquinone biosynthesis C-methylase UbiE/uncharacterized protein YbaR (Trm112 family)
MDQQPTNSLSWLEDLLVCPACASIVSRFDDAFTCSSCRRHYPVRYGIPDFRIAPDPYISIADEIRKIEGFSAPGRSFVEMVKAYYELTPESPPELHSHYIAAMDAAVVRGAALIRKLQARFPAAGRHALLDVGCGTAGMSIAASAEYEHVVGIDVALRWLVMGKARLEEAGISLPLICANAEALPFRSGSFDAVVADAVLEHVRSSARMRDEAIRVLAPHGAYFFTTNNRYSILPEPHVRILGFGLLPRRFMEPVARKVRRTPYRTRLHSRRELLKLFKGKGDVLLPAYEEGELGGRHERVRRIWEKLRSVPVARALLARVVPQYFVAGQREGNSGR